jgi:hypothetical protein
MRNCNYFKQQKEKKRKKDAIVTCDERPGASTSEVKGERKKQIKSKQLR